MKIAEVFSVGFPKLSVKVLLPPFSLFVSHLLGWETLSGEMLKCWQDSLTKQKGLSKTLNQYFKFVLRHLDLFFTLESYFSPPHPSLTPVITSSPVLFLNLGY